MKILGINLGMFYPDEDYSEIEMYKREFLPMMDDLMKTAKFVPQTVSRNNLWWVIIYDSALLNDLSFRQVTME